MKKTISKPVEYKLRMTEDQWNLIKKQAEKQNLTVPAYIRDVLVKELSKVMLEEARAVIEEAYDDGGN